MVFRPYQFIHQHAGLYLLAAVQDLQFDLCEVLDAPWPGVQSQLGSDSVVPT